MILQSLSLCPILDQPSFIAGRGGVEPVEAACCAMPIWVMGEGKEALGTTDFPSAVLPYAQNSPAGSPDEKRMDSRE